MPKVTLKGYIVVTDRDLPAVQAELINHIDLTRQEKGCLIFRINQDSECKNIFNVYEEFIDRAALESHQRRVENSRWGEISANAERHYQINEVSHEVNSL